MNIITDRYLQLSIAADSRELPLQAQMLGAEISDLGKQADVVAYVVAREQVKKRLSSIVEMLNRMCEELEACETQRNNGDKVSPFPRVQMVTA